MIVKKIKVGYLRTNCYILIDGNCTIIVDPGDEYEKIKEETKNLNIQAILITHYHFDHVGALNKFKNIEVYDYKKVNKKIKLKNFEFEIIETKGHTSDSVSFYFEKEKIMFVGDFVFQNTIGRTDLETSNYKELIKNIKKIKEYPNIIKIYPGHGNDTTLEQEIKNNEFFNI